MWFVTDVAWQSPYEARVLQSKDHVFFIPASLVTCLEPVLTGALDTFEIIVFSTQFELA